MLLRNGTLKFWILSQYSGYLGDAEGEAEVKQGMAVFDAKDQDCKLTFRFAPNRVRVEQAGCANAFGDHTSASGEYTVNSHAIPIFDF